MIQFSESYNAQTIFNQVWEAPYSWFGHRKFEYANHNPNVLGVVLEKDEDGKIIDNFKITIKMIEDAVIKNYIENVMPSNPRFPPTRTMAQYLEDLDAFDVDAILQMACFGELRYG